MSEIIIPKYESADKEEFKRPDHKDFMTSTELKETKFSGIRSNSINQDMEMWVAGKLVFRVTVEQRALNPNAWEDAFKDYFAINDVKVFGKE